MPKSQEIRKIEYAIAAVVVISLLAVFAYVKTNQSVNWLTHTLAVKVDTQEVLGCLQNAETGQRGYLLTEDEAFLQPYRTSRLAYDDAISDLRQMVADNDQQVARVNHIDSLARLKFAEIEEKIALIASGQTSRALSILRENKGNRLMQEIRVVSAKVLRAEDELLLTRKRAYDIGKFALVGLLLLAVILLIISLAGLRARIEPLVNELEDAKAALERANANIAESLYNLKRDTADVNNQQANSPPEASTVGNVGFYKYLSVRTGVLQHLITIDSLFQPVPASWYVVLVDIEKSTQAVKNGLHHEVNLAATGSIAAVMNKLTEIDEKINIPYFFGGDGTTFLVPGPYVDRVIEVLENYRHHVRETMFLTLRVGRRKVAEVYAGGRQIRIMKFGVNAHLVIPVVLGTGLKDAERIIKGFFIDETTARPNGPLVDLTGVECRWQEISPPEDEERIVCLVAECDDEAIQALTYQKVLAKINELYGSYEQRQPISTRRLKLDATIQKIRKEMYARTGKFKLGYLLKNWLITAAGMSYFKYFESGQRYLRQVSQLSSTLMMDGTFNCVISGTASENERLVAFLDELEATGAIHYGIHVTHASVMSCYVQDRKDKHIHFVDGTEGGYTTAARMFKAKVATLG